MFALIVPVAISPSILVMFWGHHRAKKLGALSLASSTYARRRVLEGLGEKPKKTWYQLIMDGWSAVDGFGLLLFAFGLVLLLAPSTLEVHAKGGYKNPSLIAMYCCGGVIFIGFVVWDVLFAKNPIWPGRLMNRTFVSYLSYRLGASITLTCSSSVWRLTPFTSSRSVSPTPTTILGCSS